tara:strand:- start:440 stop:607 length:168 start_codon:yes stop_codon:yes gene_type:complete
MSEKKKSVKKEVKKESKVSVKYKITKPNGNVIERDGLEDAEIKMYESKGCKVEGV